MSGISRHDMEFLSTEATSWVEAGIITDEQAEGILSLYTVKSRNLKVILLIAGAVLLGLGGASFIMANWHKLGREFRVVLIGGLYVASLTAWMFTGRSGTKTGRAFLLVGSAVVGAGLYLIPRMYDVKMTLEGISGLWAVQAALTGIISRDSWEVYLSQALSLLWLNLNGAVNVFALQFMPTSKLALSEFFEPMSAFMMVMMLWLSWVVIRDRAAFMLNVMISLLLLASRMSLCFGGTWTMIILAVFGGIMSFNGRDNDAEIMGLLMLGVFGLLLTWPEFWRGSEFSGGLEFLPVVNAVIVAGIMLVNVYRGHSGTGITFCGLLASRYFFDHLFGYLPKAWGFTLTGIIFVIAGLSFGKVRKFWRR
ncbi:MAG: DUF2157 domain-containing protein [Synergistaceae bacterium]|nr:DUF2157 domain-containing protein [Synergistaceae bacterium]